MYCIELDTPAYLETKVHVLSSGFITVYSIFHRHVNSLRLDKKTSLTHRVNLQTSVKSTILQLDFIPKQTYKNIRRLLLDQLFRNHRCRIYSPAQVGVGASAEETRAVAGQLPGRASAFK